MICTNLPDLHFFSIHKALKIANTKPFYNCFLFSAEHDVIINLFSPFIIEMGLVAICEACHSVTGRPQTWAAQLRGPTGSLSEKASGPLVVTQ